MRKCLAWLVPFCQIPPRTEPEQLSCARKSPGDLIKNTDSDSVGVVSGGGVGLILCLSNKLPEDGDDGTTHPTRPGASAAPRQQLVEIHVPVVDGRG